MNLRRISAVKMNGRKFTFIICCLLVLGFRNKIDAQSITVIDEDGSFRTTLKSSIFDHDLHYLSLDDFCELFNSRPVTDQRSKLVRFQIQNVTAKVSANNPFISINTRIYQLPAEPILSETKLFVPANYFLAILDQEFRDEIAYDRVSEVLRINFSLIENMSNIDNIELEEKVNGTLIKITTSKDFQAADLSLRTRERWLYLDIYGGKVDSLSLYAEYRQGKISHVVPSQISDQLAQLGFRMRDDIVEKQFYFQTPRLIFVTVKTQSDMSQEIISNIEREKKKWLIDCIVIDPGHGGRDPGAIGPNNTYEKNIVLAISKYLKDYLQNEMNVKVLMTREKDQFIALNKRTEFANKNQAKLFISIHANSSPSKSLRGVSTYFLGQNNNDEAREVARLENSVIKYESESKYSDLTDEQYILSAGALSAYSKESEDLAGMVQESIINECGFENRGVRQAGFYVLWGASMPNILIETAFISNSKDEKLLKDTAYQQKIAYAIFLSIKNFKEKYESVF